MPTSGSRRRRGGRGTAAVLAVLAVLALFASTAASGGAAPPRTPSPRSAPPAASAPLTLGDYGSPGNNWTMFMGDVEHESYQSESPSLDATTAPDLQPQWNFSAGGPIISEPIVANNRVYFGSWDGYEYGLYASNGTQVWRTFTGQSSCTLTARHLVGVTSTATLTGTGLYFGGGKDYWEALNPSNGSLMWQIYSGNSNGTTGAGYYNWASPVIYDGYAYVGLSSHCDNPLVQGQLLKVSLATHAVVGVFNTTPAKVLGATIWSSPAVDPATGTVYFATGNLYNCCGTNKTLDDSIVGINASTMALVGHFQVPYAQRISDGDFGGSVTLFTTDNGTPMIGDDNKDGLFFALNRSNLGAGALWTDNISLIPGESSAAFAHGNLFIGSARTTTAGGSVIQGAVRSLNATTGAVNWERTMNGNVFGPPVVADDVVVAAGGNELAVLNAGSGKVLWRYTAGAQFYGGPSVAGGRIYIGDVYGKMYCFGFPLAANISANSTGGPAPLHVAFHGAGFGGEAGYNFSWSFGDGKRSGIQDPHHTYTAEGRYTVVLHVSDLSGAVARTTMVLEVGEPLVQTIPGGADPSFACYDPADGDEYIANAGSSNVTVLSGTALVGTVAVGTDPLALVYDAAHGYVDVANSGTDNVSVLDGVSLVGTVALGAAPDVPAYDTASGDVYVPNGDNVTILDGTGVVTTVAVGTDPEVAAYDPVDDRVYVANFGSDNVSVLQGTSVIASVEVGDGPSAMTVDTGSGVVYVSNAGSDNVSLIQTTSLSGTVAVSSAPGPSTYDPHDGDVYVAQHGSLVSVLQGGTRLATLRVGGTPGASAYDGTDGHVYVPNAGTGNVSILDGTRVLGSIPVGSGPGFAGYASGNGYVYVLNALSDNISAILTYHLFPLDFTETGLPAGTSWSVQLGSSSNTSTAPTLGFEVANGSYSFAVVPEPDYRVNVSNGFVLVNGSAVQVSLLFALSLSNVTFEETGLPKGVNWSVVLNGTEHAGTAGPGRSSNLTFAELNGTYDWAVNSPEYFEPNETSGEVTVRGSDLTVPIDFTRFTPTFAVHFLEHGLPNAAAWSVELDGAVMSTVVNTSSSDTPGVEVTFPDEGNGTYAYTVGPPNG
ncbi:MAG TPA: PQQ-binding-like beta-propeller repeat protein, partial [Thermoplasmata archaeon]|nr:PQQ-binding-like beta-propeller repeat protein [Thermoplasmata archaeon]